MHVRGGERLQWQSPEGAAHLRVGVDDGLHRVGRPHDDIVQTVVHEHGIAEAAEELGSLHGGGFAQVLQVVQVQENASGVGPPDQAGERPHHPRAVDHDVSGTRDGRTARADPEAHHRQASPPASQSADPDEHLRILHDRIANGLGPVREYGVVEGAEDAAEKRLRGIRGQDRHDRVRSQISVAEQCGLQLLDERRLTEARWCRDRLPRRALRGSDDHGAQQVQFCSTSDEEAERPGRRFVCFQRLLEERGPTQIVQVPGRRERSHVRYWARSTYGQSLQSIGARANMFVLLDDGQDLPIIPRLRRAGPADSSRYAPCEGSAAAGARGAPAGQRDERGADE